jgi:uncharacterized membrane protein YgcG
MRDTIPIAIVLLLVFGWIGSNLLDAYRRRYRRATSIRHRRGHQVEGRTTEMGPTEGYDWRDQRGDDWGSGTRESNEQGSADGGGDSGGSDSGGSDSGGDGGGGSD